jgi:1,2-diacylglycerol 3-beta-galactosyltransferase
VISSGGGHRASAEALEAAMEREAPGRLDVAIVDVWTQYGAFPFNKFVPSYRLAAKYPNVLWRSCYFATSFPPLMAALNLQHRLTCSRGFAQCMRAHGAHHARD